MVRKLALALLVMAPSAAMGQQANRHDVPWFESNPGVLYPFLQWCHRSAQFEDTVECRNAESANDGLWARELKFGSSIQRTLSNPAYWAANPIARNGVLIQCGRRQHGDEQVLPYCPAAAKSLGMGKGGAWR